MKGKKRLHRARRAELQRATSQLGEILLQLDRAYLSFNTSADPALTDACIYEINALRTRYDLLLRHIKSMQIPS